MVISTLPGEGLSVIIMCTPSAAVDLSFFPFQFFTRINSLFFLIWPVLVSCVFTGFVSFKPLSWILKGKLSAAEVSFSYLFLFTLGLCSSVASSTKAECWSNHQRNQNVGVFPLKKIGSELCAHEVEKLIALCLVVCLYSSWHSGPDPAIWMLNNNNEPNIQ